MRKRDVERCPTLADMERASDGELSSPAERAAYDDHLRQCPACRERRRAHAAFALRLAGSVTAEADALVTRAGLNAHVRSARFAQALHTRRQARIHHRNTARPLLHWLAVAVIAPLLVLGLLFSRTHSTVVQAEELLTRAVSSERVRPIGSMQRVRIRLMPSYASAPSGPRASAAGPRVSIAAFLTVRELADGVGAEAWPTVRTRDGEESSAMALLARHGFDWRTPLSIAPVRAWRDRLRARKEHVTPHGAHELLLRTVSAVDEGELREVQVTVRRGSFRVTRQLLIFTASQLEIEEVAEWVRATPPPALVASAPPVVVAPARPDADALMRAELDARLVLRDAGADLGGLVRVSSADDMVRVDGRVPSASVRRALQTRLTAMPLIEASLAIGEERLADPGEAAVTASRPALGRWLDRTFGAEPSDTKVTFVPRLERLIDVIAQRLVALDALAVRYRGAEAAQLSPAAQAKLQRLLDLHYAALNADLLALDRRVAVLFGSAARPTPAASAPADWSRRVNAGLVHARALDRRLDLLLTRDDLPTADAPDDEGRDALAREFAALWEAVNAGAAPTPRQPGSTGRE